jgi:uncharacterized caspase-like protein
MRFPQFIAVTWLALTCALAPAHAEKRVALVIGNAAYRNMMALQNPQHDAEDVGGKLRELGFEAIVATDLDRAGMNDALRRFTRIADGADIALVFYSGHGMQFNGTNYLMPTEARLDTAADVNRFALMPVDDVLEALRPVRGARILLLDACRNNPVEQEMKRRVVVASGAKGDMELTRGLKPPSGGNGLLIAYATQANEVANDGIGRNSPFTTAFLKHVSTPNIDLRQMLFRVQDDVDRITNHRQRPELAISLIGEFYLSTRITDVQAWSAVRATKDPTQLWDFITQYPTSVLVADARQRLAALEREQFEQEKAEREKTERERTARENLERERLAREQAEREQAERGRIDAEQAERAKAERDRIARETAERERLARLEEARREEERLHREQADPAKVGAQSPPASNLVAPNRPAQTAPQPPSPVAGSALVRAMRSELKRVGCYSGVVDDEQLNGETKAAMRKFARYAKLASISDEASIDLLEAIRGKPTPVCPLECGVRQFEKNGACIAKTCPAGKRLDPNGECIPTAKPQPHFQPNAIDASVPSSSPEVRTCTAQKNRCVASVQSRGESRWDGCLTAYATCMKTSVWDTSNFPHGRLIRGMVQK